jgi:hypothetical protein
VPKARPANTCHLQKSSSVTILSQRHALHPNHVARDSSFNNFQVPTNTMIQVITSHRRPIEAFADISPNAFHFLITSKARWKVVYQRHGIEICPPSQGRGRSVLYSLFTLWTVDHLRATGVRAGWRLWSEGCWGTRYAVDPESVVHFATIRDLSSRCSKPVI